MNKRYIRYIKKGIKILASAIIALLILLLIGTLIFQLPKVQHYIANRVVQKVKEKTGAHLAIDNIAVFLWKCSFTRFICSG